MQSRREGEKDKSTVRSFFVPHLMEEAPVLFFLSFFPRFLKNRLSRKASRQGSTSSDRKDIRPTGASVHITNKIIFVS